MKKFDIDEKKKAIHEKADYIRQAADSIKDVNQFSSPVKRALFFKKKFIKPLDISLNGWYYNACQEDREAHRAGGKNDYNRKKY